MHVYCSGLELSYKSEYADMLKIEKQKVVVSSKSVYNRNTMIESTRLV